MTTALASPLYTPDDLLRLSKEKLCELVDGQLVEKQMDFRSGECTATIIYVLKDYLKKSPVGKVVSEVTFQCFPHNPDQIRRPDIAFVSADQIGSIAEEGHVKVAPDLAIEVISSEDRINYFEEKLADYRAAGIRLVWEVNPTFRYVRIHYPDRTSCFLEENDMLTGEMYCQISRLK